MLQTEGSRDGRSVSSKLSKRRLRCCSCEFCAGEMAAGGSSIVPPKPQVMLMVISVVYSSISSGLLLTPIDFSDRFDVSGVFGGVTQRPPRFAFDPASRGGIPMTEDYISGPETLACPNHKSHDGMG